MTSKEKTFCNRCRQVTNHSLLHEEIRRENDSVDDEWTIEFSDIYFLYSCAGCEQVHLMHRSEVCENRGDKSTSEVRYPPLISRAMPKWLTSVFGTPFWTGDTFIEKIMKEIYVALSNECPQLAALGIRALIEFVIIDKVGDHGSFSQNLEELHLKGHIVQSQKDRLHAILEVGHAAMHRQHIPKMDELYVCLDIVELVIEDLYVHHGKAEAIRKRVPPRKS